MKARIMKLENGSAVRNRDEILEVLLEHMPMTGTILEIAAGAGIHCTHFAPRFPNVTWQPADRDPRKLASIRAYAAQAQIPNLQDPMDLDTTWDEWPIKDVDGIININMIHASPWESAVGLFKGAYRTLVPGGILLMYGAYFRKDRETVPSNLEFDKRLQERDPSWGLRSFETVVETAESAGLTFDRILEVPNNNYAVLYRKP
jgi:cyclopropane fatty-acyl-phospholipid synthase-like methyltransferase